ncbi:MAG TPA: hypothetical protein VKY92_10480 [Verrucomicrobiae bacterium]|nr:hypothetical protein [Verrucomicrobiae bacterium]
MKYKFKLQKSLLVGGLLAATYAEACWVQTTSFLCVLSGAKVDDLTWADGSGPSNFTATSDWWFSQSANFVYSVASGGNQNHSAGTTDYCHGPATFKDYSLHNVSVPDWQKGTIDTTLQTPQIILTPNSTSSGPSC